MIFRAHGAMFVQGAPEVKRVVSWAQVAGPRRTAGARPRTPRTATVPCLRAMRPPRANDASDAESPRSGAPPVPGRPAPAPRHEDAGRPSAAATAFGAAEPTTTPTIRPGDRFLALSVPPPPPSVSEAAAPPPSGARLSLADPWDEQVTTPHQALDPVSAESVLRSGERPAPRQAPRSEAVALSPSPALEPVDPGTIPAPSTELPTGAQPASAAPVASSGARDVASKLQSGAPPRPRRAPVLAGALLGVLLGAPALWWALRPSDGRDASLARPEARHVPGTKAATERIIAQMPRPAGHPRKKPPTAAPAQPSSSANPAPETGGAEQPEGSVERPERRVAVTRMPEAVQRELRRSQEHFEARRYRQAFAHAQRALDALPPDAAPALRARVLTEQGRVLLERGPSAIARAVEVLKEATGLPGAPAEAWLLYGRALADTDPPQRAEAIGALRRYERAAGSSLDGRARRRLHRLLRRLGATPAETHGRD